MSFRIFLLLLALATLLGAAAQPLPRGTVEPRVTTRYLGWDGRALGVTEAGAAAGVLAGVTMGAAYRTANGHGRTAARRYTAAGWQAWTEWQPISATATHPGITLHLEGTHERIHLRSADDTSSFAADPAYAAGGAHVRVTGDHRGMSWHAQAGLATARLNDTAVATVASVGGQLDLPLGRHLRLQPALVGYADDFQGQHLSGEARLALRTPPAARTAFALEVSLFPRGVPLAGTPLSPAATAGAVYGDTATTQLRTHPVAYVSCSGGYRF
jgi:hypothetical protein